MRSSDVACPMVYLIVSVPSGAKTKWKPAFPSITEAEPNDQRIEFIGLTEVGE
jgi:hypothetical protein